MSVAINKQGEIAVYSCIDSIVILKYERNKVFVKTKIKPLYPCWAHNINFLDDDNIVVWGEGIDYNIPAIIELLSISQRRTKWCFHIPNDPSSIVFSSKKNIAVADFESNIYLINSEKGKIIKKLKWQKPEDNLKTEVFGFYQKDKYILAKSKNTIGVIEINTGKQFNIEVAEGSGYDVYLTGNNELLLHGNIELKFPDNFPLNFNIRKIEKFLVNVDIYEGKVYDNFIAFHTDYNAFLADAKGIKSFNLPYLFGVIADIAISKEANLYVVENDDLRLMLLDIEKNTELLEVKLEEKHEYNSILMLYDKNDTDLIKKLSAELMKEEIKVGLQEMDVKKENYSIDVIKDKIEQYNFLGIVVSKNIAKDKLKEIKRLLDAQIASGVSKIIIMPDDCQTPDVFEQETVFCFDKDLDSTVKGLKKELRIKVPTVTIKV